MEALGRLFDVALGFVPTDAVAGAITGQRAHLKNYSGVTFIVVATGTSTDITDIDVQQYTAATGGTTADLDVVTRYYYKSATSLDNSSVWTKATQAAASEITDVGAASQQLLLVIEVDATSLSDGYQWVGLNVPDLGTNGTRHVACVMLLRDPYVQRAPALLTNPLA
jgi:hypothetical protein